ncbi:THO3 [Symbiodinium necroappetens]|uniref:THO3 protein n=1 Tax=Symbiodinium necroappetens TaxID=1628268 RepID=A0A813B9W6_9DINO|nr:THO3 [Symbiodinium necroappetens]
MELSTPSRLFAGWGSASLHLQQGPGARRHADRREAWTPWKPGIQSAFAAACLGLPLRRSGCALALRRRTAARAAPLLVLDDASLKLKVILLERGASGRDSDVLVGEVGDDNTDDWKPVRLQATDEGKWEDAEAEVSLTMSDSELFASLCPAREPATDFGMMAPSWPRVISSSLGPWPLKGPGYVLFDAQRLGEVAERLSEGRGPVVLPGGAELLDLPSTVMVQDLFPCLMGSSLSDVFGAELDSPQLTYEDLLQVCPLGGTGAVDLTRVTRVADGRVVDLGEQPFNMQYMSRRWSRGAVIKAVGKNGVAERAGIKVGDIIVTINGEAVLNATLERVEELLAADLPVRLEVAQPVLEEPLYIREASTELLTRLADDASEKAAAELLPKVSELMDGFRMNDALPQVFAGDGGSASHVHMDLVPMVQMCHVVHGIKIFGVDATCGDEVKPWVTRFRGPSADAEVALHVDQPIEQEHAEWLASRGVSIAVCGPGDVMLFWGGNPHFGANGLGAGPCVKKDYVAGFKRSSLYAMDWAGDKLLVAAKDGPGIRLQDVERGEEERSWPGELGWMSIRTDPNDPRIAAAVAWNGKFKIFDTRSSSSSVFDVDLKKTAPNMRDFLHLCWSPDSKNIALSNRNDQIYLLNLKTPKGDNCLKLGSSKSLNVEVNQMAYTPSGDSLWVAAGGTPGKIHIFPSHTLQSCEDQVIAHNWTAISMACDPTGHYMCTGGADGLICVWEHRQPLCLRCFLHPGQVITNVDFNYNGSLIAWGTGAGERSLTLMGSNTAIPYYQDLTPATVTFLRWHSSKNVLAYSLNASQMPEDRPHRDRRGYNKDTPIIQLLKEFSNVEFVVVDVDKSEEIADSASIDAVPTFLVFKGDAQVGELVGADEVKLKELIQQQK